MERDRIILMRILYESNFKYALIDILHFISKDKISASKNFKTELKNKIKFLKTNPTMYRASIYIKIENYRDLVFKGYTVIYKIDYKTNCIKVLDIFKWMDK